MAYPFLVLKKKKENYNQTLQYSVYCVDIKSS